MNNQILQTPFKRTVLSSTLLLALSAPMTTQAAQTATYLPVNTSNNNFTMLSSSGGLVGAVDDVSFTWDGTLFDNSSDYTGPGSTGNATLASPSTFFGYNWTAHDIQIFGPGTYSFNTIEAGTLSMTVGANQIGAHMLFNWGGAAATSCGAANCNIDVAVVWDKNSVFNGGATTFMLASVDPSNPTDSIPGIPMVDGGFVGFNANFSILGTLTAIDTTPDSFIFTDQDPVTTSTVITSASITVSGINSAAVITVSGGTYDINSSGTFVSTPGTVNNGDTVRVQHTSSASNGTATNTTLTIGGVSDIFTSITTAVGPDTIPTPFTFTDQSNVALNSTVTSAAITVGGINAASPISVINGTYDINNSGTFVSTAGTVNNGDTVRVRHTSSGSYTTSVNTTLDIGGITDVFTSTTRAADTTPTGPITFTSLIDQTVSTVVTSSSFTVTGILDPTPISINNGQYEINNSGTWASSAGTVNNGDTVRVRHTTASGPGTNTVTTLNIGGVTGTFTSVTAGTAVSGGNFTMLSPANGIVGGTNDVTFNWNGLSMYTSVASADAGGANAEICSNQPFFSNKWKAYQVKIYGPGTYTLDTADTMGGPGCPFTDKPTCASGGLYSVTVGAGQVMAHMKFAWSASQGIDVVAVWNKDQMFGPSIMYTGAAGTNSPSEVWAYMSTDWDGDGINGGKMIDGPFVGFSANFNMKTPTVGQACSTGGQVSAVPYEVENPPLPKKAWGWCSISTVPVSPMERGDWWLVAGFLGWLAAVRRKYARSIN